MSRSVRIRVTFGLDLSQVIELHVLGVLSVFTLICLSNHRSAHNLLKVEFGECVNLDNYMMTNTPMQLTLSYQGY